MKRRFAAWAIALLTAAPAAAQTQTAASVPGERARLLESARTELTAGRRAQAARLLAEAGRRFGSVQALLQLARLQAAGSDVAAALESLTMARTLAPNSEEVLSAFAQLTLASRAPMPAVLALEPLTRMHPAIAQYHYLHGVALMQLGDMAAALESLMRAEKLEPNRPLTLIALGLALNNRKQHAAAKEYLLRALEVEPENVEGIAALAEAEEGVGELQAAERNVQRALAKSPAHPTANLVMGLVYMQRREYAEARDALLKTVMADPGSSKAHYQLNLAYARLGDTASAEKHQELYRRTRREAEERVMRLLGEIRPGGMGPIR